MNNEGVKFLCDECDSKFTEKGHLKRHKMAIHKSLKYPCNECDFKGNRQAYLKQQLL